MKIGIDAYYLTKANTSMGIFQDNILKNIINRSDLEFYIFTDSYTTKFTEYNNIHFYFSNFNIIKRNLYMKKILDQIKIDVFYASFNIIPLLSKKNFRIVLQNHDWSHGIYSENLKEKISGNFYKYLHKSSATKANINIANSEFTAKETKKYANRDSIVIYHDSDPFYKDRNSKSIQPNFDLPKKYILYVGRVFPKYKNITSILYAYNNIKKNNKNISLIIVHSDNFRKEDYYYLRENKLDIINFKSLCRANVKFLYENAFITLYPSLYEGFGYSIVEGQSAGSPMLVSSFGPIPEVAGDSAIYFDGTPSDLYSKLSYIINHPEMRDELIKKGYNNVLRFNWRNTAKRTLEVLVG